MAVEQDTRSPQWVTQTELRYAIDGMHKRIDEIHKRIDDLNRWILTGFVLLGGGIITILVKLFVDS